MTITHFLVYNRWGALLFSATDSSVGWDGSLGSKPQPAGTYVWMFGYYNPLTKKLVEKKGTVTLVR